MQTTNKVFAKSDVNPIKHQTVKQITVDLSLNHKLPRRVKAWANAINSKPPNVQLNLAFRTTRVCCTVTGHRLSKWVLCKY